MPFDFDMLSISPVNTGGGGSANITSLNVTPTTSAQTITASGSVDGYSPVNVSAVTSSIDANIVAGNIKKDVRILGVTGTYEGSAGGKYQLLERIKDDNNNEIGTVSGFFTDANDVEYAVVCLDARYRSSSNIAWGNVGNIPNLPIYDTWAIFSTKETATFNTQKIIDAGLSSAPAATHCRSLSFVIGGTTYYGQLMNVPELVDIMKNYVEINNADTSGSEYASKFLNVSQESNYRTWTSNIFSSANAWHEYYTGSINQRRRDAFGGWAVPILELPNV